MRKRRASSQPAQMLGALAIIFNGGLDVDGWSQHEQNAEDYGYDEQRDERGAHRVANGLRQDRVEDTVRLRVIVVAQPPRAGDESASRYPDCKGQGRKGNYGYNQSQNSHAE